jgi:hypothetical protein
VKTGNGDGNAFVEIRDRTSLGSHNWHFTGHSALVGNESSFPQSHLVFVRSGYGTLCHWLFNRGRPTSGDTHTTLEMVSATKHFYFQLFADEGLELVPVRKRCLPTLWLTECCCVGDGRAGLHLNRSPLTDTPSCKGQDGEQLEHVPLNLPVDSLCG